MIAANLLIGEEPKSSVTLFSESFDDADLLKRNWYDGSSFKIVSDGAFAGKGCIEYRWKENATKPHTSSGARHPLKATVQLYIIFTTTDVPNMKWNQFLLTPYFGPGLLPHGQALWIDELVVSTERIGPLSSAD